MSVLETIFSQLLRMAATALPVMVVVLALRLLLRRAPRKYAYVLWAVVGFRLICPVTLSLPVSIFNLRSLEPAAEQTAPIGGGAFSAVTGTPAAPPAVTGMPAAAPAPLPPGLVEAGNGAAAATQTAELSALSIVSVVWLVGVLLLLGWFLAGLLRLRRQVAQAVRQDGNVWECDGLSTPFVLGLFRPRIYIPFHLGEEERRYVLAHERCHIRRRDYLMKPLALLILAVYWWNPAVWLCWVLFCRDMEMRCDEAVLEELGDEVKTGYSASLLSFALDRRIPMALAFGEHDASRRVKHVLDWKRARPAVVFLALAAVVLTAVVCGTNATTRRGAPVDEPPAAEPNTSVGVEEPGIAEPVIAPEELLGLLPKQYIFASGAGGWRTMLYLNEDGTFTGDYIDMDMGSNEAWGCSFHGRFALPERIEPFFWRMSIEELTVTGLKDGTEVGDTYVEDGTRYTVTEPYGLNNADELLLYLPGIATASLPEGFFNWARGWGWCLPDYYEKGFPSVFPFYGLHNAAADQGWVAVTEDESYAVYVDFRSDQITHTASQLYTLKSASLKSLAEGLACYDVWAMTTSPENVKIISADDGALSLAVAEPSLVTDWDALTALAGNNAAMLLALRGELTQVEWQVWRDEKFLSVTLERGDESWLLPSLEGDKSTFMEYGESQESLEELIGLLESGGVHFHSVMTEPFRDVLGYDGHIETETMGFWQMSTHYAETAAGTFPIAECFGFGGGETHRVDLDGDGQEELVCNVTFGGDGAQRAYVYQRRADGIYLGTPSIEGLQDHFDWGVNSWWSEYDWDENVFRVHYDVGDGSDGAVLETHGLERMEFQPYNG